MFLFLSSLLASAAEFGPTLEGEMLTSEVELEGDTGGVSCSDQFLRDGVQLPDLPLFYVRNQPDAEWGTVEMIDLLVDAGRHVRWLMPSASPFVVGDISRTRGGELSGHITHRGGVDADIGIYKKGGWQHPHGFTTLAPSELDVVATWALMQTFLDSGMVDFILLDTGHIRALRAYTLKRGLLTSEEADRIFPSDGPHGGWNSSGIVRHAPHHQDHLHLRVLCGDGTKSSGY